MNAIVQNLAIRYEDQGNPDGPVLLFLHGWKNDLHTFDPLVLELSSSCRIIRLDLPGFGRSEMPREDWDIGHYADFAVHFVRKIGISPDVLVGHSLGGRIIMKGIATGIFNPKKIILIASAGIAKRNSMRNGIVTSLAKIGKAVTSIPPFSVARENLRGMLYEKIGSDYGNAGAMKGTFLKVISEDLSVSATRILAPTLLIWGEDDTETPLADGRRLHRLIHGSELVVISGAGHFVHREKSQAVARMTKDFIKK